MNAKGLSSERGQAIVLVLFGFVVLLGFAALAVDGSMVYADRRFAQNAADAASLAGGSEAAIIIENAYVKYSNWDCGSQDLQAAASGAIADAIARAADNGYIIDNDIEDSYEQGVDDGGVVVECMDQYGGGFMNVVVPVDTGRYMDIHTRVTAKTSTAFIHFVYGGEMLNTVDAVTRVRPRQPLANGNAIVALNPAGCSGQSNGATFHGNAATYVLGGGVWSNGCLRGNGHPIVDVTGAGISYVGQFSPGNADWEPYPQWAPDPIDPATYYIDPPNCNHPNAWNGTGAQLLARSPLSPGLYCVSGALRINGNDDLVGSGVSIVLKTGELRINGNATVQLTAPLEAPDPSPAIPGILFYLPPENHSGVQINGNSESFFEGTILATGGDIDWLGTGNTDAYKTQVIGWNVEAGGTADLFVNFQDANLNSKPTMMELAR